MPRRARAGFPWALTAAVALVATVMGGGVRVARACSELLAPLAAFPAAGATEVSPASSIVVMGGPLAALIPTMTLEAAGMPMPLPTPQPIGAGRAAGQPAQFVRLPGPLLPSTSYVLRVVEPGASPRELTRFSTAAAYVKTVGTPATIERVRLWRVRYPVAQIGAGGCVFDEYMGYIDIEWKDGAVPETPPAEVIGVFTLTPRTGSNTQSFVFSGDHFTGQRSGMPVVGVPEPTGASWQLDLAPDREYCLTLTTEGRNDLANLPLRSNTVCAPVMNVDLSGGAGAELGDGGVTDAPADAAPEAGPTDAEQRDGSTPPPKEKTFGCAMGGGSDPDGGWVVVVSVVLWARAWKRSRRRPEAEAEAEAEA